MLPYYMDRRAYGSSGSKSQGSGQPSSRSLAYSNRFRNRIWRLSWSLSSAYKSVGPALFIPFNLIGANKQASRNAF